MSLRGFEITKGIIGLNTNGDNREFAMIANGVAVTDKLTLDTLYTLRRVSDAEALGIDADYDEDNSVNVYRHICEFYRNAEKTATGKKLHIYIVAQTVMVDDMNIAAKTVLLEKGQISDMIFCFNPATGYTETPVDGLNPDVFAAIPVMQEVHNWSISHDRPCHMIIECRGMADSVAAATDLRDLTADCPNVSVVAGQDWKYADGLWALGKKFADAGTYLGVIASQKWNHNPGEVASNNLQEIVSNKWSIAGLSNHKTITEMDADLDTLNDKGYTIPVTYNGISGIWWNDGHTCTQIILDSEGNINEHEIYYAHAMDESMRALRIALLPEVKKVKQLKNGKMTAGLVAYYEALGNEAFNSLAKNELVSGGKTTIDPDSDLLIAKELKAAFVVNPTGCIGKIKGVINLKNS